MMNYITLYKNYFIKIKFVITLCICFVININNSYSQSKTAIDFKNYQSLEAKGKIPQDFLKRTSQVYQSRRSKNVDSGNKKTEKDKEDFDLMTSFYLRQLLWSGTILFGDEVSSYVQEVGEKVLENYPDLKGKVRFYVTKEYATNAFTTPEGIIFVNIGLIARLDNEAQLAYIISHEITHYVKKHSINQFLFNKEIEKQNKKGIAKWFSKSESLYEQQMSKSSYSKEQEIEADEYGLEIFTKTNYDLSEALKAFESLEQSQNLYDTLIFKSDFLNNSFVQIPNSFYYRDTTHIIEREEIDSATIAELLALRTHPDIEERLKNASNLIEKQNKSEKRQKFIVSEERFYHSQKIARYELCNLYLEDDRFIDAIYHALLLKEKYGESKYTQVCIARALYSMANYDRVGERIYLEYPYNEINWEGKNWYFAFEEFSNEQLSILATAHLIQLAQDYQEYNYIYKNLDYNIANILDESKYPISSDLDKEKGDSTDILFSAWLKVRTHLYNKDSLIIQKAAQKSAYIFSGKDYSVAKYREDFEKRKKEKQEKESTTKNDTRLLLIRPIYFQLPKNKKSSLDILAIENGQNELNAYLSKLGTTMNFEYIDINTIKENEVDKYNDLLFMQKWFGQTSVKKEDKELIPLYDLVRIEELAKKYNVGNFGRLLYLQVDKINIILVQSQTGNLESQKELPKITKDKKFDWRKAIENIFVKNY